MPACLGYGQCVVPAGSLGVRQARARAFWAALFVAACGHLVFTPLTLLIPWLRAFLERDTQLWDYDDDKVVIPITLFDAPAEPNAGGATPGSAATEMAPAAGTLVRPRDAGAPPSRDAALVDAFEVYEASLPVPLRHPSRDAGVAARSSEGGGALASNAPSDAGAGGPGVQDPLSLVGGLRRAVEGSPNVSLVIWFSTIRQHPLGPLVGNLFSCIPQWRDFVSDMVDPLQDFEGVAMFGPQMKDTSKVTILAQSRMEDERTELVFAALAHRPGATAVAAPVGMRAVRFRADRAERVALTHPRSMIIVTPPEGFEQLRDLKGPLALQAAKGRALSGSIVNPWRPARFIGLRLPETLRTVRIDVSAASDGGAQISVEFDDENPAAAETHSPEIADQVRAIFPIVTADAECDAHANRILCGLRVSRLTSAIFLGYIRSMLCPVGFDGGRSAR